jgi:Gpi18-like mannosyltransferase
MFIKSSKTMSKKETWQVLIIFLFWLFALSFVSFLSSKLFTFKPTFPYAYEFAKYRSHDFFERLANFDGVHYLGIAANGYLHTELVQAFFPFYPFLMRSVDFFVNNFLVSGLLISHFFALLSFYAFYYLVKMDFKAKTACWSLIFFAFFVSSFYLRSLYSESLFLTLVFASLIAAKKKLYLVAGLLGALASATRVVGIFIWPSLLLMVFIQNRHNLMAYLAVSLSTLGLLAYMLYLQVNFQDPLYFFHMQEQFGANRQTHLVTFTSSNFSLSQNFLYCASN